MGDLRVDSAVALSRRADLQPRRRRWHPRMDGRRLAGLVSGGIPMRPSRAKRGRIDGQFVWRLVDMLRSPANRVLSLSARRVLDRLEIELADHGGKENGRLPLTFADLVAFGLDRHAIAPALNELEALGFVRCTERGRAGNAEFRTPSRFRLTYRHGPNGEAPTDEWRAIKTLAEAHEISRGARMAPRRIGARKQKPNGGKSPRSVLVSPIESRSCPMGETRTTLLMGESPTTLDISGRSRRGIWAR